MRQLAETPKEFGVFTGSEIYRNATPREVLVEGFLHRGDNLIISSRAGLGKSILALQLIASMTTGDKFLDTFQIPKPLNVLYVQTEGDRAETIHRLTHMKKALRIDDNKWVHFNAIGVVLNTIQGYNEFIMKVQEKPLEYDVAIIDPLYATVKGSLSADDVATEWQRHSRKLKSAYPGLTYIIFHHEPSKDYWDKGKRIEKPSDDLFGSTMWAAWMSSNFKMVKGDEDTKRILISGKGGGKGRSGEGVSEVHLRLVEPSPLMFVIDDTHLNETEEAVINNLYANLEKGLRRNDLERLVDKSKATVCRALATLQDQKKIEKIVREGLTYYKILQTNEL